MKLTRNTGGRKVGAGALSAGVVGALIASAALNHFLARRAERRHPAAGRFVEVDGVRVHVREYGSGEPLVLIHGNGSAIEELESSGLIDLAARSRRVIAFDRPGYGHSPRPRGTVWTPGAQAELIFRALETMGVAKATVFGHSWGTLVAVKLGLNHPELVQKLVLASGYYYPTVRTDVLFMSAPAMPVLGTILRHTVSPLLSRLMWPLLLRKIFGPMAVPRKFRRYSREMAVRPSQIQASAADSALMIPSAAAVSGQYRSLSMPIVIIAGEKDRVVDIDRQAARLHKEAPTSVIHRLKGAGHMIHQNCTHEVWAAIAGPGPA